MNWWWKKDRQPPPEKRATFATLAAVELTWTLTPKGPLPDPKVGVCVFCHRDILVTEDHFTLSKVGTVDFGSWGDVESCEKCAVEKGLRW